jgi:ATP-dependent Clp protease ATP-binding subunit ClpC
LQNNINSPDLKEKDFQVRELESLKEDAVANQQFEKAASYRDQAETLRKDIQKEREEHLTELQSSVNVVDEDVIGEVISMMTGIPLMRIDKKETARLLAMEDELQKRVIGQEEAVKAVSRAVRRSRAGIKNPKRPAGCFLFVGPTGVGKTHLAKALAEFMFGEEEALIQLDMSEYMEKFNVSKLIGAPPGFVGYEEGGQLTEKVRRRPYSVILLDEIEKAHHDVFNILLQMMEEGRITDAFDRAVDFRNTIIIMTSNVGARHFKGGSMGFINANPDSDFENVKAKMMSDIDKEFKPEFINRLDHIVAFRRLTREDIIKIVDVETATVNKRLLERGITLTFLASALSFLIENGYDKNLGARPLRRAIERHVEDELSEMLLRGEIKDSSEVTISHAPEAEALSFQVNTPAPKTETESESELEPANI